MQRPDNGLDGSLPRTPFLLVYGPGLNQSVNLGVRATFSDIAATIREALAIPPGKYGTSF